jgi:hypothetical protein
VKKHKQAEEKKSIKINTSNSPPAGGAGGFL